MLYPRIGLLWLLLVSALLPFFSRDVQGASPRPPDPSEFSDVFPIVTQGEHGLYSLDLPFTLYQRSRRAPLRDLRVFNAEGWPVPFFITPVNGESRPESRVHPCFRVRAGISESGEITLLPDPSSPPEMRSVPPRRQNHSPSARETGAPRITEGYLADLGPQPTQFTRMWIVPDDGDLSDRDAAPSPEQKGILVTARLYASADMKRWRRGETVALGKLSLSEHLLEHYDLPLSQGTPLRYLLLTPATGATLFPVREIRTESRPSSAPLLQSAELDGHWDEERRGFGYALPRGLPVRTLDARPAAANYLLRGTLLVPRSGRNTKPDRPQFRRRISASAWESRGSFLWYAVRQGDQEIRNSPLPFAVGRSVGEERRPGSAKDPTTLLLRPEEGTSWPEAPRLLVTWETQRLYFIAQGQGPFRLAVGLDRVLPSAEVPPEALLRLAMQEQRTPTAELNLSPGTLSTAPAAGENGGSPLVWGIFLAGVAIMIALALHLLRGRG